MKDLIKKLNELRKINRRQHHPLIYKIHRKYGLSSRTLHYIKSYGKDKNIVRSIIKQSIGILIFASVISSFGGIFLENLKDVFVTIIPLIILLPTLNDMIGDYGMIISSRYTTLLYKGRVNRKINKNKELKQLLYKIIGIALLTSSLSLSISLIISKYFGYNLTPLVILKLLVLIITDVIILITILFLVAFFGGRYIYRRGEDPDNFLIPITTSIADFGNMIVLSILVVLFF